MRTETMATRQASSPADLVNRVKAGDPQAEAEIVECYDRGVRFIIRQDVNDHAAADDLYQEAFRIVLEKIRRGEVREPEKLTGFVWAVVRNLIISYFRRTARQKELVEAECRESFPHPAPDQLEALLQKENAELVRQVFNRMRNKRDIQVLFRFYILEESKQQICADLGLTNLDFNHILYRARNRYRKLYERLLRGE